MVKFDKHYIIKNEYSFVKNGITISIYDTCHVSKKSHFNLTSKSCLPKSHYVLKFF